MFGAQPELPFRTWGGSRPGAGRRKDLRRRLASHTARPPLSPHHPVHVTLRVRREVWNLRSRRSFRFVEAALRAAKGADDARFVHYSVQGNHIHLIVEASDRVRLWRRVQGFEIRVARGLNRMMGRKGAVFSDRYHARVLKTPLEVKRALAYVLSNRARHVPKATGIDPYSSGPWFVGWRHPPREVPVVPCLERGPPVRAPGTWLLRAGWKRRGLIPVP